MSEEQKRFEVFVAANRQALAESAEAHADLMRATKRDAEARKAEADAWAAMCSEVDSWVTP